MKYLHTAFTVLLFIQTISVFIARLKCNSVCASHLHLCKHERDMIDFVCL